MAGKEMTDALNSDTESKVSLPEPEKMAEMKEKERICLKIGLYNSIPDLGGDHLNSYKNLIVAEFKKIAPNVDLDVAVGKRYNPYADSLASYFTEKHFDMLEIDMATKEMLAGRMKKVDIKPELFLKPTVEAVKLNNEYIGYPTLACGNFIIEVKHSGEKTVELDDENYQKFKESAEKAENIMVGKQPKQHARLLGGKLDDTEGWYLPFIYLDGVIDLIATDNLGEEIQKVIDKNPNPIVIKRLRKFATLFEDESGKYVEESSEQIIEDVAQGEAAYFFGFSEKLSEILKKSGGEVKAFGALSAPIGSQNKVLVFTDGLVINNSQYEESTQEKKEAIQKFIDFFTGAKFREEFVMGRDLNPPQIRYLLPTDIAFYEQTKDVVYNELYNLIKNGISAPALDEDTRKNMEDVLHPLIFGGLKKKKIT